MQAYALASRHCIMLAVLQLSMWPSVHSILSDPLQNCYTHARLQEDTVNHAVIHVLGVSGRLPESRTPQLAKDAPSVIPLERWDIDGFAKLSVNKWEPCFGSFILGAQQFDRSIFRLSR